MLEQMTKGGPVYICYDLDGSPVYKKVKLTDVSFGIPTSVEIQQFDYTRYNVTIDGVTSGYLNGDRMEKPWIGNPVFTRNYLGGIAKYKHISDIYLIHDKPVVELTDTLSPSPVIFELPKHLSGFPYERVFSYLPELNDTIGHLPSTYVDRLKRPLNLKGMKQGLFYPIAIDDVTNTFNQLPETIYPRVVQLRDSPYVVVDVEPGYSIADIEWLYKYPMIYMEDTPNGGKHVLMCSDDTVTKYRVTAKCEIIVNTMVTFYGINAKWFGDFTKVTFPFEPVIHHSVTVSDTSVDEKWLQLEVERLNREVPKKSHMWLTSWYKNPKDLQGDDDLSESRLDFLALLKIWRRIKNHINEHPAWVLASYTRQFIPFREKHDSLRSGVPYLVYLATVIIEGSEYSDKT